MPRQYTKEHDNREEILAGYPGRVGHVTLDADLFSADSDGHIHLQPGMLLSKPTASDLWGPYYSTEDDGRQTATDNLLILADYIDLKNGDETAQDKEISVLLEAIVKADKIYIEKGGTISTEIKTALRSSLCDIQFQIGS